MKLIFARLEFGAPQEDPPTVSDSRVSGVIGGLRSLGECLYGRQV